MKVCLVVGAMNVGGVQTFLLNLGRYLVGKGDEVHVIATVRCGRWWERLSEEGMSGELMPRRAFHSPATHAVALAQRLNSEFFHAVFLNHVREGQLALPLCHGAGPVYPIIHNDTPGVKKTGLLNSRFAQAIVAVSPSLADYARRHVSREKVVQLDYPVTMPSDQRFEGGRSSWCAESLRLIYVGRIQEQQKGVFLIPDILKLCAERGIPVTLDVVGDGEDRPALERALQQASVETMVRFRGACSSNQVIDLLLESHVLLMPSHYEGLGIVAVEAQACGCVPIATRFPGVTDHSIRDRKTGFLVNGRDAQCYAEHLLKLAAGPALWGAMSDAGRRHVRGLFGIESAGAKYRLLIERGTELPQVALRVNRVFTFLRNTRPRDWVPNRLRPSVRKN